MSILETINSPDDLRQLSEKDLVALALDTREFLLKTLNETGGHFAAGMGTVELTIALHYLFNTPHDDIIWDVGHQAYPHKILSDRKHSIGTIRKKDGLAPFPRIGESPYDAFGVGHSSTSISAALGMTLANKIQHKAHRSIAVIGDGAMTAGMAFEAMNHAGDLDANLIVVLNDNDMSISGNVGALSNYFARILSSKMYTSMRSGSKKILSRMPPVWEFARRTETHLKGMVVPGTLFEELGFNYIGPIDGHCLPTLLKSLKTLKGLKGPQLLHVITQKGKGYTPAEQDPIKYHAVSPGFLKPKKETPKAKVAAMPSYSNIFGNWLCDMAEKEPRLAGITPAMREGSGLVRFAKEYPEMYFDVGIAEQHSVTLAAGLAAKGMKPVVAIYSTFLQRAYDQLIHDVAIQNLPVVFALDRAGVVGDGPTHSGNFDLSYLRCIPNMVIMTPSNANECRHMLYTGIQSCQVSAVRYPRGSDPIQKPLDSHMEAFPIGKAKQIRNGQKVAILNFGSLLPSAMEVANDLGATVVDMRFVKPIDEEMILNCANSHDLIVTLEENVTMGGAGSAVNEVLAKHHVLVHCLNLGLPDYYIEHGTQAEMLESVGLHKEGILKSIELKMNALSCKSNAYSVKSD